MGGHGGLNILPQKKWNVYNYDNRAIVQKDKMQHAQKTKKKYEFDRAQSIQNKFSLLKSQTPQEAQNLAHEQIKKDSLITGELKKLAQQNQHINLFQKQQQIIENRQLLEYQRLKQSQWLKDKELDYSSKFLGTYNDDSKIPWYVKNRDNQKLDKKLKRQRFDIEEMVDQVINQKAMMRKNIYKETNDDHSQNQKQRNIKLQEEQTDRRFLKRQVNEDRQRSRDKKHEFLKSRQLLSKSNPTSVEKNLDDEKIKQGLSKVTPYQLEKKNQQKEKIIHNSYNSGIQINPQMQALRQKRLKRQQKERKKAEQLKQKLFEATKNN